LCALGLILRLLEDDPLRVTAPTLMWVAALDSVLEKLKSAGVPFNKIQAISGSGEPTSILGHVSVTPTRPAAWQCLLEERSTCDS